MVAIKIYNGPENKTWMESLAFCKDEINIMQNRLGEISEKNNSKGILSVVENFQNQLKVQRNTIDQLKQELYPRNYTICSEFKRKHITVDYKINSGDEISQKLSAFERAFNNNRISLDVFLTKWM
jgi:hypothetical protein